MQVSVLRTWRWSALLVLCLLARPSVAQEVSEEGRRHFEAGVAHLQDPDGARYAEAFQEFQAAYAASPSWKILGNLGLCAMKLERDGEAIAAWEKYLQEGGADLDAEERSQVERDLNTLKASLSTITVETTPSGATITDERQPPTGSPVVNRYGPIDAATKIGIKSGHHRITAQLAGHDPVVWEFDAAPGGDQTHTFELKPTPAPTQGGTGAGGSLSSPTVVDEGTPGLRIASYVALGVGVVGLGAGTFFALDAKKKADDADDKCGGSRENCNLVAGTSEADEVESLNSDSGSSKTMAIVGFAVGGVGIAAGVAMLVASSGSSGSSAETAKLPPKPRLTPWLGYKAAGVSGTF
jgi:hypothetical protein